MAAGFREGFVAADGFRIRHMEAGEGSALVHLHGAGGLRLTPAHELLSRKYRVVAFEMPGFGASAENTRTRDTAELARTMAAAAPSPRPRPLQPDGHLVRRQGGAVAGSAEAGKGLGVGAIFEP